MNQQELADWFDEREAFANLNSEGRIDLINIEPESPDCSERLGEATDVETIRFMRPIECRELEPISGFSKLKDLDLREVSGNCLDVLLSLQNLEYLRLILRKDVEQGMVFIGQIQSLENLTFHNSQTILDRHLAALSHLGNLKKLLFYKVPIGTGISFVQNLPELEVLDVRFTNVSNDDLEDISRCKSLRLLDLPAGFSDKGLIKLSPLQKLENLALNGDFTEVGIQSLNKMKGLKSLTISQSTISEQGLTELAQLQNLEYIRLSQDHIPLSEIQKLRAAMPNTEISAYKSRKRKGR